MLRIKALCPPRSFLLRRLAQQHRSASNASVEGKIDADVPPEALPGFPSVTHGAGDAVIRLNVGGKEFVTLRSTVAANYVLADYVARAEANQELTHGDSAVFIDRDPTHFGIILQHLRNKVDGLSYSNRFGKAARRVVQKRIASPMADHEVHVQLPKDLSVLRDLFVEASHYKVVELQNVLCTQNFLVGVMSAFGAGKNPFDVAKTLMATGRSVLLAAGSVGTVLAGTQMDLDGVIAKLPWKDATKGRIDSGGDHDEKGSTSTKLPSD